MQRLVDRLRQVLAEQGGEAIDQERLFAVLDDGTDLSLLGRLVLGRYWRDATPRQRESYLRLFRSYMVQTFVQRLRQYVSQVPEQSGPVLEILSSRPAGDRDIIVKSRLVTASSQPLQVDWRLRDRPEGPVIIDLVIEGISLLVTQRSEFAAVLERSGIDGLLAELHARVTQST